MLQQIGHPVIRLIRVAINGIKLGELKPGHYRPLTKEEVGAIFSVTGAASFLGEPEKNTVLMLVDQINKAGGINGHPLKVIIEDPKSDET